MYKDPTEWRNGFKRWKETGESPWEAGRRKELPRFAVGTTPQVDWKYWDNKESSDYIIPFIQDKAVKLTNAGVATGAVLSTNLLDSIADNAERAGLDLLIALGLATKESTLGNPTDDRSAWNLSSGIRQQFNNKYPGTILHINNGKGVTEQYLINYHKGDNDHKIFSFGDLPDRQSILLTGFEFYKLHPDKYNPGLSNYLELVNKRGAEVMNSPEVKKWQKDRNIRKAVGRFGRVNPLLKESKFNLPKFAIGTEGDNWYKYVQAGKNNEWSRITNDDMSLAFLDLVVRPKSRGGNTTEGNWKRQWSLKGEPGLEIVSPEFDILTLGAGARTNAATQTFLKNRKIANAIARGLNKNPILRTYNSSPQYLDTGGNILNYQDFIESLFPNSKVKDVVYHSTLAKPFEQFDPGKIKRGYGFYFNPSENHLPFDRMVYSRVNIQNPLEIFPNKNHNLDISGLWRKDITKQAIKDGLHDGVIGVSNMRNPGEPEIVALNPNQIHILGSNKDKRMFKYFMEDNGTNSWTTVNKPVKYIRKPYSATWDDFLTEPKFGKYFAEGGEAEVYESFDNPGYLTKVKLKIPEEGVTLEDLEYAVNRDLKMNLLPGVEPITYKGFSTPEIIRKSLKQDPSFASDEFVPIWELRKLTPLTKTKVGSFDKTTYDDLIREWIARNGYKEDVLSNMLNYGNITISDYVPKNFAFDAFGNMKLIDPMIQTF